MRWLRRPCRRRKVGCCLLTSLLLLSLLCASSLNRFSAVSSFLLHPSSLYVSSPKHSRTSTPLFSVHASENLMGGMPLALQSSIDIDEEDEEEESAEAKAERVHARLRLKEEEELVALYKAEFAQAWAEEAQWRQRSRKAESTLPRPQRPRGAAQSRKAGAANVTLSTASLVNARLPSAVSSPALLLPAASHSALRGRVRGSFETASASARRPPFAVAVLMSLNAEMCRSTWLQFRSVHRLHPGGVDFVVVYESKERVMEWRTITSDPHCRLLYSQSHDFLDSRDDPAMSTQALAVGRVRFLPVTPLTPPPWHSPRFERWTYSYNKLPLLSLTDYARILFLDGDVLVAASLADFFALPYPLAAALDTAQNCRMAQTKLNAGVLLFAPSPHLYSVFLSALHSREASCISGQLEELEQELLNCVCGLGQGGAAALPMRPDVECGVLPYYANAVPSYTQCDDYDADEVILVHFADLPKPWHWPQSDCIRLAINATWEREDEWFAEDERRHCFTGEAALYTFYHCMEGGDSLSHQPLLFDDGGDGLRDCRLVSVDQQRWAVDPRTRAPVRDNLDERLRRERRRRREEREARMQPQPRSEDATKPRQRLLQPDT